jgi:hypothetical protein
MGGNEDHDGLLTGTGMYCTCRIDDDDDEEDDDQ